MTFFVCFLGGLRYLVVYVVLAIPRLYNPFFKRLNPVARYVGQQLKQLYEEK